MDYEFAASILQRKLKELIASAGHSANQSIVQQFTSEGNMRRPLVTSSGKSMPLKRGSFDSRKLPRMLLLSSIYAATKNWECHVCGRHHRRERKPKRRVHLPGNQTPAQHVVCFQTDNWTANIPKAMLHLDSRQVCAEDVGFGRWNASLSSSAHTQKTKSHSSRPHNLFLYFAVQCNPCNGLLAGSSTSLHNGVHVLGNELHVFLYKR